MRAEQDSSADNKAEKNMNKDTVIEKTET